MACYLRRTPRSSQTKLRFRRPAQGCDVVALVGMSALQNLQADPMLLAQIDQRGHIAGMEGSKVFIRLWL